MNSKNVKLMIPVIEAERILLKRKSKLHVKLLRIRCNMIKHGGVSVNFESWSVHAKDKDAELMNVTNILHSFYSVIYEIQKL